MREPSILDRSISDQAYDLLGQLLAQRDVEQMMEELRQEAQSGADAEMQAFFARQEKKHRQLIARSLRRQKVRQVCKKVLPVAAAMAAMLFTGVAVGGAPFGEKNAAISHLDYAYTNDGIRVSASSEFFKNEFPTPPEDYRGQFFPTYLPEGLELTGITNFPGYHSAEYRSPDDNSIYVAFNEEWIFDNCSTLYGSEDAVVTPVQINQYQGIRITLDSDISVAWGDGLNYFSILSKGLYWEETLRMAQSVQRIVDINTFENLTYNQPEPTGEP